jgi:hypothetical protein
MAFEFHLEIDTPKAHREGKTVVVGFTPLQDTTPAQFTAAIDFLRAAADRMETFVKKHGVADDQRVLPETQDQDVEEFTDEDRKALQEEVEREA